jgi:ABC-2 type transport system ATP-binding protein
VAAGTVTLPELVRQLDAAGVAAEDVSLRRPTLDEVFLDRTGDPAGNGAGNGAENGPETGPETGPDREPRHEPGPR